MRIRPIKPTIRYIQECLKWLKALRDWFDTERAHGDADDILLSFCPQEIIDEWQKIEKWYA